MVLTKAGDLASSSRWSQWRDRAGITPDFAVSSALAASDTFAGYSVLARASDHDSSRATARSRRQIVLTQTAIAALRRHRTAQAEERLRLGPAWDDNNLVFAKTVGRPIEVKNDLASPLAPLRRQLGPDARRERAAVDVGGDRGVDDAIGRVQAQEDLVVGAPAGRSPGDDIGELHDRVSAVIAATTAGCACPTISGPQEHTRSTYS